MTQTRENFIFLCLYILFIVYGSLFPLSDWQVSQKSLLDTWANVAGMKVSRSDLLVNLLAYIPFGFLLFSFLPDRYGKVVRIFQTILFGTLLSFFMEYIQLYLPARTSSPVDLLLNTVSTALGSVIAYNLGADSSFGTTLRKIRSDHFCDDAIADIGIAIILIWSAAQLAPFAPSLDISSVKNALKPLWLTLNDFSRFNGCRLATYSLNIFSIGTLLLLILRKKQDILYWLGIAVGAVLLSKIAIVGRQLSLEAVSGLVSGLLLTCLVRSFPRVALMCLGGLAVVAAFIVDELRSDYLKTVAFHDFNWIPFGSQVMENVTGIGSILEGLWTFAALGFFVVSLSESGIKYSRMTVTLMIAVMVFALEYAQTGIVGRYPDITSMVLSCLGYQLPWIMYRKV